MTFAVCLVIGVILILNYTLTQLKKPSDITNQEKKYYIIVPRIKARGLHYFKYIVTGPTRQKVLLSCLKHLRVGPNESVLQLRDSIWDVFILTSEYRLDARHNSELRFKIPEEHLYIVKF